MNTEMSLDDGCDANGHALQDAVARSIPDTIQLSEAVAYTDQFQIQE